MIDNAFGLIVSGERTTRLKDLTLSRSTAAVPFGGRYRIIDFILSNMVNAGLTSVGLITEKNYHSLMDHLGSGKEWDLHRKRDGLFILPPFMTKDNSGVFHGAIDAIRSVIGYVRRTAEDYVILAWPRVAINMDLVAMMERHLTTGADITILYAEDGSLQPEEQSQDLRLIMDEKGRVTEMELDAYRPRSVNRSCDVMILKKELLEYLVEEAYARGEYDFHRDILLKKYRTLNIMGYKHEGFLARVESIESYFAGSMALLNPDVQADLFNPQHPIYTKVKDEVAARYSVSAQVKNALVADGCVIEGQVENCILFRGVHVKPGARVFNSIIMQGAELGENTFLDHVILDKGVKILPGRTLQGYDSFPIVIRKNQTV
ncbi:MAG: glucose-1-phosphate adenylyltransferase subunit GlgD [Clostridia bacterium]|nr:glucose-1-phosphate adenylyltransferase subunit GlgD [Clostridia bacterium]MBR0205317.1 glucose-1-phosphate adenylyltransferase subunit GlgD [Clostridia bacterium]